MNDLGSETAKTGRLAGLFLLLGVVISVSAWQMFVLPREAEATGAQEAPVLLLAETQNAPAAAQPRTPATRHAYRESARSIPSRLIHPGTVAEPASEVPDAEASRRNRLYEFIPLPEAEEEPSEAIEPGEQEPATVSHPIETGTGMPWYFSIESLETPDDAGSEPPVEPAAQDLPQAPSTGVQEEAPMDAGESASPEGGGLQVVVLGPPVGRVGDLMTFSVLLEGSSEVAHAPLRVQFDPDVLEYVIAREGPFLASDGASTHFFAMQGGTPGQIDLALSRVPPARGISGNGTLCELTFRAIGEGESPVVLAGSRLLDPAGYPVAFRRNDIYVAIQ